MAEARRIRTLAISELPDQDCCTLLTPRRVETRARIDDLRRIEIRLDAEDLAEELARSAHEYRQETLKPLPNEAGRAPPQPPGPPGPGSPPPLDLTASMDIGVARRSIDGTCVVCRDLGRAAQARRLAGDRGGRGEGAADQGGQVGGHAGQLAQVGLDQRLRAVAQRGLRAAGGRPR